MATANSAVAAAFTGAPASPSSAKDDKEPGLAMTAMVKHTASVPAATVPTASANAVTSVAAAAAVSVSAAVSAGLKLIKYAPKHTTVAQILATANAIGREFLVKGAVRAAPMLFVHLSDGSCASKLQLVLSKQEHARIKQTYGTLHPATRVKARVLIRKSEGAKQRYDAHVVDGSFVVTGPVREPTTFLPALKRVSMERWRRALHVRVHSEVQAAIFRIRARLSRHLHAWMAQKRMWHLDPNILTGSDCEGAGQMFIVTTFGEDDRDSIPVIPVSSTKGDEKDNKTIVSAVPTETTVGASTGQTTGVQRAPTAVVAVAAAATAAVPSQTASAAVLRSTKNMIDWSKDFFGNGDPARLTVSSQLGLEFLVPGMGPVYTTNKSFRAEKSKTKRHQAEFTHFELESDFDDFGDLLDLEEEYVVDAFELALSDECTDDVDLLERHYAPGLRAKLQSFVRASPWKRITYHEALAVVQSKRDEVLKFGNGELKELPKDGDDLGGVCERFLSEKVFGPMFAIDMPTQLKSFYMKRNANGGKTVQGGDLLIPGLGELIGGSMRESDYDTLGRVMLERKMYKRRDGVAVDAVFHARVVKRLDETKCDKGCSLVDAVCGEFDLHFGPLQEYLGLRKNGAVQTGGFGLGFERLVTICTTNLQGGNIREASVFPVAWGELAL